MAHIAVLERRARDGGSTRPTRRAGEPRFLLWAALGGFAIITALGLRSHTLWFDEMQAWNIARASGSPGDLVANLRYEGHPILWYLPLYALTRLTGNPHAMQVLQFLIAVATAAIVLFRAPLRPAVRVVLLAGYFFAFEYGVFSRSYGLGVLLLVVALTFLARPAPRWVWATAALLALAFTSLPGAVLAVAVAATVVLSPRLRAATPARVMATAVVVGAALVTVLCVPPDDFGTLTPGLGDSSRFGSGIAVRIASSASAAWRALVPVPATVGEWNSNLLDGQPGAVWIEAALAVGLFAALLVALRAHPFARRLWWVGSVGLFAFFVVVTRPEAARHAGFVFLLFVACLWTAAAPPGEPRPETRSLRASGALGILVIVVLAAQVLATLAVYPRASTEDFSRDPVLADAIVAAGLDGRIVSAQDWDATTIGGYVDRDVHSLARDERIRFVTTDERQECGIARLDAASVVCDATAIARRDGAPVAVVVAGELPGYRPLVTNDGASVYVLEPDDAPSSCRRAR